MLGNGVNGLVWSMRLDTVHTYNISCDGEESQWSGLVHEPASSLAAIVGFADLTSSDLDNTLQRHCKFDRFRGIRQMLNFHADKPQYSLATHDNYLTDPNWIQGFGLLEKYNLSFELQVLPHQMNRYG